MRKYWRTLVAFALAAFLAVASPTLVHSQGIEVPSLGPAPTEENADEAPSTEESKPAEQPKASEEVESPETDSLPETAVALDGKLLFHLTAEFANLSPAERVAEANENLQTFANNPNLDVESIQVGDQDGVTVIFSGQTVFVRVTEADAEVANSTLQKLSSQRLRTIRETVLEYRQEQQLSRDISNTSVLELLRKVPQLLNRDSQLDYGSAVLYTFIASAILGILLLIFQTIFLRIYINIRSQRHSRRPLRIRNFELLSGNQVTEIGIGFVRFIRLGLTLIALLVYLVFVLSLFSWTRKFQAAILSNLIQSLIGAWDATVAYLPNLFNIALILLIASYLLKFIKPIFDRLEKGTIAIPGFYPDWAAPTYRLIEFFIFALTAIIVFPYLPGFGSTAFQGVSIFLGVLVSLGSTAAIANAVSGIILIYTRAFQLGDRVQVSDTLGNVEEKLLLVTRIRTFNNEIVTIPNSVLISNNITNYSASERDTNTPVMLTATVTLGYDVPWRDVYEVLKQAALDTPNILVDPEPFVLQTGLGDFSVTYELKAATNRPTIMEAVYSDLYKSMQDKCNEAGIEILSPTYSAVRDGNQSTMPESYLPADYAPPGFNLHPLGNLFQIDLSLGQGNRSRTSRKRPPDSNAS